MHRFVIVLSFFWPCLCLAEDVDASRETAWQEVKKANGIQLYSMAVAGTPILKFKAVATINADIDSIKAVIDDVEHYPDWMPYLVEARQLKQTSVTERLFYNRFNAVWPARDRDVVYRVHVSQHEDGSVIYQQQSQQSDLMPKKGDHVRAELLQGGYHLIPIDENKTRVELLLHADPQGQLPLWIVNIVQGRLPFESLQGLVKQVAGKE